MTNDSGKLAALAMTADDHRKGHGTPPPVLVENPGKKLHETMDDVALGNFLGKQVFCLLYVRQKTLQGDRSAAGFFETTLDSLIRNFAYLRKIGRLPEDCTGLNLLTLAL